MKKFLLLLALVSFITMNAQTPIFEDNFDDEDVSDWYLLDQDGDGNNWGDQFTVGDPPITPVSLISRSWMGSALTPDNWAITPAIDFSGVSGMIELKFVSQVAAASWDEEHVTIYVATAEDLASLEASDLFFDITFGDEGDTGAPTNHALDISAMAGEASVYIAFRHHAVSDMDFISIDDVVVEAETVSVEDLQAKGFTYAPNPVSDVLNLGANSNLSQISVVNLLGQEVYASTPNALQATIDFANLNTGVYMVNVTIGDTTGAIKIVKE